MSYYEQLIQFLEQAKTDNLKTKHFDSDYLGTKVRVSFGQGNVSRIPWISFLIPPNKTSKGIYPVYLYYKKNDLLVLAYGVSETDPPMVNWSGNDKVSIREYFKENRYSAPERYGNSYVFKVYKADDLPSKKVINEDLESIITEYKHKLQDTSFIQEVSFDLMRFQHDLKQSGLIFSDLLILRFVASLLTKPFVILTGLSGSGKTRLAHSFAQWICADKSQYLVVPVGSDWTNREPLLGYPNALDPDDYVKPEHGSLDLILKAVQNPDLPYFLILDEMNLSHVERYFADFLSAMESGEKIPLHSNGTFSKNQIPADVTLPDNLFIIGTVNIDETTHMFSPKVLDRANTIEFRVTRQEMETFLKDIRPVQTELLRGKGAGMGTDFINKSKIGTYVETLNESIRKTLLQFFEELGKTGAEFGYRSAAEILKLISQLSLLDDRLDDHTKVDVAIMQKLLPKLHGSRRKLCPVLEVLGGFCLEESENIVTVVFENEGFDFERQDVKLPLSLEKIIRMYREAVDNGFASFAEA